MCEKGAITVLRGAPTFPNNGGDNPIKGEMHRRLRGRGFSLQQAEGLFNTAFPRRGQDMAKQVLAAVNRTDECAVHEPEIHKTLKLQPAQAAARGPGDAEVGGREESTGFDLQLEWKGKWMQGGCKAEISHLLRKRGEEEQPSVLESVLTFTFMGR